MPERICRVVGTYQKLSDDSDTVRSVMVFLATRNQPCIRAVALALSTIESFVSSHAHAHKLVLPPPMLLTPQHNCASEIAIIVREMYVIEEGETCRIVAVKS